MARKQRIHYSGAVYHVILRGNAGQDVFFDDNDRYRFYLMLQLAVEKFGCLIHGFCLMTNHIHLIMQAGEIPLSKIMQNITLRYTKWINYRYVRTGHVFQGRYKALLLDADAYLMELVRYVHLNPVRAGMVSTPVEYRWSGHSCYLGIETVPWLSTNWLLNQFSEDHLKSVQAYADFVADGMDEKHRDDFHVGTCEGRILGNDTFLSNVFIRSDQMPAKSIELSDEIEAVCQIYSLTIPQLIAQGKTRPYSEARAIAALFVLNTPNLSLTELGIMLNRDAATLGRSARKADEILKHNSVLTEKLDRLNSLLRK